MRQPPLSTSFSTQITLYIKSLLLPPFGFLWGYRYLRQSDNVSKYVGIFTLLITAIEIIWIINTTVSMVNLVNQQVTQQMNLYGL